MLLFVYLCVDGIGLLFCLFVVCGCVVLCRMNGTALQDTDTMAEAGVHDGAIILLIEGKVSDLFGPPPHHASAVMGFSLFCFTPKVCL